MEQNRLFCDRIQFFQLNRTDTLKHKAMNLRIRGLFLCFLGVNWVFGRGGCMPCRDGDC